MMMIYMMHFYYEDDQHHYGDNGQHHHHGDYVDVDDDDVDDAKHTARVTIDTGSTHPTTQPASHQFSLPTKLADIYSPLTVIN